MPKRHAPPTRSVRINAEQRNQSYASWRIVGQEHVLFLFVLVRKRNALERRASGYRYRWVWRCVLFALHARIGNSE